VVLIRPPRRRGNDDGAIAVLVAVVVVTVVLPLMALVVDLGLARVMSSRARGAADAAALAAAAKTPAAAGDAATAAALAAAQDLVTADMAAPDGGWPAAWASCEDDDPLPAGTDPNPGNCISFDYGLKQVRVTVPGRSVPSIFSGVIGSSSTRTSATSTASWGDKISPTVGSCALCVLGGYSTGAEFVRVSGGDAATGTLVAAWPGRLQVTSGGGVTFATSWTSNGGYLWPTLPVKRPVQDPFAAVPAAVRATAPGGQLYGQPSKPGPSGPCSPGIYQTIDGCTGFAAGTYFVTGNPSATLSMSLRADAQDVVLFFTCSANGSGVVVAAACPSGPPPRFAGAAGAARTLAAPNEAGPALVFDSGLTRNEFLNSGSKLTIKGDVYGPNVTLRPGGSALALVQGRVVVGALSGNLTYRFSTMLQVDAPPVTSAGLGNGVVRLVRSG